MAKKTINYINPFFQKFLKGPFLSNLYPENWYNDANFTHGEFGFVSHENKLLGVPRIRQVMEKEERKGGW